MWYEILPSAGIIFGAMALPSVAIYYLNKVSYGNAYRRELISRWDRHLFQRDHRLTGDAYRQNGLEAIPD